MDPATRILNDSHLILKTVFSVRQTHTGPVLWKGPDLAVIPSHVTVTTTPFTLEDKHLLISLLRGLC